MSRPQNVCVYCGKPGRSREHYWGKWLSKLLNSSATMTDHFLTHFDLESGTYINKLGPLTRQGGIHRQQIKAPCRACNSGWMKKANERARPTIERLAFEGPWEMTEAERASFARWAVLMSMTYEFADLVTVVTTQEERDRLRCNLTPPDHWGVFIAPYSGGAWTERHNHRALALLEGENAFPYQAKSQTNAFVIGKTFVNTVSGLFSQIDAASYGSAFGVMVVWPLVSAIAVPPITDDGIERLLNLQT